MVAVGVGALAAAVAAAALALRGRTTPSPAPAAPPEPEPVREAPTGARPSEDVEKIREKLRALEKARSEGRISERTYRELRDKYEEELERLGGGG